MGDLGEPAGLRRRAASIVLTSLLAVPGLAGGLSGVNASGGDTVASAAKKKKKCKKGFVRKKVKGKKKCVKKKTTPVPVTSVPVPAPAPSPAPVAYNSCTNPYWTHTLRCQFFPDLPPQPNLGEAPANTAAIADFTRVFLDADPSVRATDGTIPVIYVDKAVCTNPGGCATPGGMVAQGSPIDSDNWVVTMSGGDACVPTGAAINPGECLDYYEDPGARAFMGTSGKPVMKGMEGIHRDDPVLNPTFAGYNRIRVEKSTFDRYNGRASYEAAGGFFHEMTSGGDPVDYDLYLDGFNIMEQTLLALQDGLSYRSWRDNGGAVEEFEETLPALSDADKVLFVGHSNAAHGLYMNIDYLREQVEGFPGFAGDVRALFDANFLPSAENEAAFTPQPGDDAYDHVYSGTTTTDGDMFSFIDVDDFYRDVWMGDMYESWEGEMDASCLAAHPDAVEWQCLDRIHVLLNHISTPFFYREDFTDTGGEHTNGGTGHLLHWGPYAAYDHCPVGELCPPRLTVAEHRTRLNQQAQTLLTQSDTDSELAMNTDTSVGTGNFPTVFSWMPSCGSHEGSFIDDSFYYTTIDYGPAPGTSHSMREWLEEFMAAAPLNAENFRIDGFTDGANSMTTTDCDGP